MRKPFDVVLYGATGFTGVQTVAYFRQHAPPELRWAIAGRNRAKLEAISQGSVPVLVADAADRTATAAIAAQARVVATTAGPFSLYGTPLVDACVEHRTHYCDITGETPWVLRLINRHHAKTAADGTRIVPFCGFDSIPSDYGAWLLARHFIDKLGACPAAIESFFEMAGGVNGGTLATAFHLSSTGEIALTSDPFLLSPGQPHTEQEIACNADPSSVRHFHHSNGQSIWTAPFVMGPINTRIVRRTQALLGMPAFDYQEYMRFGNPVSAYAVSIGMALFEALMGRPQTRNLLQKLLPSPGQGPSESVMDNGWFRCLVVGRADDGASARLTINGKGDPGNRVTVKCLCESALQLAQLPEEPEPGTGGVLTPVAAFGESLIPRLAARGIHFLVE